MKRLALLCTALLTTALLAPAAAASSSDSLADVPVSGAVTDAVTGAPVSDVCVSVFSEEAGWWDERACTDDAGAYAIELAAGRYRVQFDPRSDAHGTQWWPLVNSPTEADWLVVRRGQPVTGVDAVLHAGATLTGRAIEGATGQPMRDACVEIYSAAAPDEWITYLWGVTGSWSAAGLPPGEVTAKVRRCDSWYRLTWAYDALTFEDATTFELEPGETTNIGRLALVPGATLSGTVTSRRSGKPLDHIIVADSPASRSGEPGPFGDGTDEEGRYLIEDVQPGTWYPNAYQSGYKPRWAIGWADGARDPRRVDPTVLEPGGSAVINFRLDRAASITGTLSGELGPMLADGLVRHEAAADDGYLTVSNGTLYHETGKFEVHGLPATKVLVRLSDYEKGPFYYDGQLDPQDATLIKLRPGQTVDLDAHLPPDW